MGFGKLFIGCFIAYIARIGLGDYGSAAILTGYVVMLWGLVLLREYQKAFLYPLLTAPAVILVSIANVCRMLDGMFLWNIFPSALEMPLELIGYGLECLYLVLLLLAVRKLAQEVDLPKLSGGAVRNLCIVVGYYVYQYAVLILSINKVETDARFLTQLSLALHLVCALFNLWLLFGCYRQICPEGEEDMAPKPSRFAFVNRMRAKQEERERKAQEETEAYLRERRERKKNGNQRKKRK